MHSRTMRHASALVKAASLAVLVGCAHETRLPTAADDPYAATDVATANAVSRPGRVTTLAVVGSTENSITIKFTQVGNGAGAPANYDVRVQQGALTWWEAASVTSGSCATPLKGTKTGTVLTCTINGLSPSTTYGIQLVAFRGTLNVDAVFGTLSNAVSGSTAAPPPPPPPPPTITNPGSVTNLGVSGATDSSLTISFTQVTNGAGAAAAYEVRAMQGGMVWWEASPVSAGTCVAPLSGTGIGTTRSCTIKGLVAGTQYSVQLVAFRGTLNVDAVFGDLSNIASGTTTSASAPPPPPPPPPSSSLFWEELVEDGSFAGRGWYDNTSAPTTTAEHAANSTRALAFRWTAGAQAPIGGAAMRKKFTNSNSVFVSYDVKYSANYVGSGQAYHPHEFHILSSLDGDWDGLSNNWMTIYIEQYWANGGRPRLAMQDNKAINMLYGALPLSLLGTTEDRSTGGCNGVVESGIQSECFAFAPWYNKKQDAGPVAFQAGRWHHVEAYVQLNTIVNGVGVANGVWQYWVDGVLVIDRHDLLFRTGARANLQLNQFVIAPYIGDGSPADQTMWVDNIRLAARR
jgi:hypothetical protein